MLAMILFILHIHLQLISTTDLKNLAKEDVSKSITKRETAKRSQWCYQHAECRQGAAGSEWEEGVCKNGSAQSPINLNPNLGWPINIYSFTKKDLVLANFTLANTGSKITLTPRGHWSDHYIKFVWGNYYFFFDHVEFHWGPYDDVGSEHTIAGISASMEMQMFYWYGPHGSMTEALNSGHKAAVAIIGVLLVADPNFKGESDLYPIVSVLSKLTNSNKSTVDIEDKIFHVKNFLPGRAPVFMYHGSMTSPPCQEVVLWLVLRTRAFVKPSDVEAFRGAIKDEDGNSIKMNYRKLQQDINVEPAEVQCDYGHAA